VNDTRVIFMHIPKTGGSTVQSAFHFQHPRHQVYEPGEHTDVDSAFLRYLRRETDEYRATRDENDHLFRDWNGLEPERQAEVRVLLGHFWFGAHERVPGPTTYFTMVRDPVDRALSLYAQRVERHGLRSSLEEYVTAGRDDEAFDAQTRRLATTGPGAVRGPVTQTMLDVAMERLDQHFCSVGVLERLDDSIIALAHALEWTSMGYVTVNRSRQRPARDAVAPATIESLIEHTQMDAQLHRFAMQCLDTSLANVDVPVQRERLAAGSRTLRRRERVRKPLRAIRRTARRLGR
jgi:hypothetical protein